MSPSAAPPSTALADFDTWRIVSVACRRTSPRRHRVATTPSPHLSMLRGPPRRDVRLDDAAIEIDDGETRLRVAGIAMLERGLRRERSSGALPGTLLCSMPHYAAGGAPVPRCAYPRGL